MNKALTLMLALIGAVAARSEEYPEYRIGNWPENDRGNHRAVVEVPAEAAKSDAVRVRIPWRRRDQNPETKQLLVFAEQDGRRIDDVLVLENVREYGELAFAPRAGAGRYFVYYLPYAEPTYYFGDPGSYYSAAKTGDEAWYRSVGARLNALPEARTTALEARTEFDSMYPMEVPATTAETKDFLRRFGGDSMLLFPETRDFPIRMQDELPLRWIRNGPAKSFETTARPNEYLAFQIGVYAPDAALRNLKMTFSDLDSAAHRIPASALACINLTGVDPYGRAMHPAVAVETGRIQPLWVVVRIPSDAAGRYTGRLTLAADGVPDEEVSLALDIAGEALDDSGVSDLKSMARLAWLNSAAGLEPRVIPPFTPIRVQADGAAILDREIAYTDLGLPADVTSRGRELLAAPVEFTVEIGGTPERFSATEPAAVKADDAELRRVNRASGAHCDLTVESLLEFDGCLDYEITLRARDAVDIDDVYLTLPFRAAETPYMMGLGQRGGLRSASRRWNWDDPSLPLLWLGGVDAGMQIKLEQDLRQPEGPPEAWRNGGAGAWTVETDGEQVRSQITSGARHLAAGTELRFRFRLLLTPFKRIDPRHWDWRYQSQWGGSGDRDYTMALLFHGDSSCGNTFINYPFLETETMGNHIRSMAPDTAVVRYPAEGNLQRERGNITVWARPTLNPAAAGPGMRAYPLLALTTPGGDSLGVIWSPGSRGIALSMRNGYDGLKPVYLPEKEFDCARWPEGVERALTLSWEGSHYTLALDGQIVADGDNLTFPDEPGLDQTSLSVIQSPAFRISAVKVQNAVASSGAPVRRPDAETTFFDDFQRIAGRVSTPLIAGNPAPGRVEKIALAAAAEPDAPPEFRPDGRETAVMPVLYYSARELSNHVAELWALRSLGDEVFAKQSTVYAVDGVQSNGSAEGYPWLREHLRDGYSPAWRMPLGKFNDASVGMKISRWDNYYIEGMDYLMRTCGVRGLYLDGVGYDRKILQRMAKVMKRRDPDSHINVHYIDAYTQLGEMTSSMLLFMEYLPYVDSLWFGELFSYDLDPDYWLVELSGIPFGVTGEMLNYQNGGNPWRGMVYGMTSRMLPCAESLWRFWDDFGIQDAEWLGYWDERCPVTADRDDVRLSVYRKPGKTLVALAHWPRPGSEERELAVPSVDAPPPLGGQLNEFWWEKGAEVGEFTRVGASDRIEGVWKTDLRLMRDRDHLYVGIQGVFTGELKHVNTERDSDIYSDDSVDLFFENGRGEVIHYIVNAAGGLWDAKNGDKRWNGSAVYRAWFGRNIWDNQIWHGTLAIPLADLGGEADSLRFNACRTSFTPGQLLSSWAPVNEYSDSAKWGRLLLADGAVAKKAEPETIIPVRLQIDWTALGLDPATARIHAPRIKYFQPEQDFVVGGPVTIENSKGILLEISDPER